MSLCRIWPSFAVVGLTVTGGCNFGGDLPSDFEGATGGSQTGGDPGISGGAQGETPAHMRLPFTVADHFVPFGFMGAGTKGAITDHPNDCLERPDGAQGICHSFTFIPTGNPAEEWGGLYWLSREDNWGSERGVLVEPGARQVRFLAATSRPGAVVRFLAGGIDAGEEFADQFAVYQDIVLGDTYQSYSLSLEGTAYEDGVLGGFGFSAIVEEPMKIWLDDIRWE